MPCSASTRRIPASSIGDQEVHINTPQKAIQAGMAFCPEDRKTEGIVAELSIRENIILALQAKLGVFRFLSKKRQSAIAARTTSSSSPGIKVSDAESPISQLSGGNQQGMPGRAAVTNPRC